VAEAVRSGWAEAVVCLRLVTQESDQDLLNVHEEFYNLCFPELWQEDYRIQPLLRVVRSSSYCRALDELPDYGSAEFGELQRFS
jgi:hypothetical protein